MSEEQHLDVDALLPPKRTFSLAGETVDVSVLPSRVVLEIARDEKKFREQADGAFDALLEKVECVCRRSNPRITREWLLENTSFQQLMAVIEFVLAPLQKRIQQAAKSKKATGKNA